MLTTAQIAAGRAVHQTLRRLEHAQKEHHAALAGLRDAFRNDMTPGDFDTFAGTPKDDPPGP